MSGGSQVFAEFNYSLVVVVPKYQGLLCMYPPNISLKYQLATYIDGMQLYLIHWRGCTYYNLHCDRDGAVKRRISSIFGHHCQIDQPLGNHLIVERPGHAYNWGRKSRNGKGSFLFPLLIKLRCEKLSTLLLLSDSLNYFRGAPRNCFSF